MPLVESVPFRREKIVLCGPAGCGKTSAALSAALWAHLSGDTDRRFWFLDFEDSAGDLLIDKKYAGMTNIEVVEVPNDWPSWIEASQKVVANAKQGDWIIGDMVDRGWKLVQNWESETVRNKSSAEEKLELAKAGGTGWDLMRQTNWQIVNSQFDLFMKPLLLSNRAHLFFTTEVQDLGAEGRSNEPESTKNARRDFGRFKPAGQKSLGYQARSVLRLDRVARGRILYTLKDRSRDELSGADCKDFFLDYCRNVGGWTVTDPE